MHTRRSRLAALVIVLGMAVLGACNSDGTSSPTPTNQTVTTAASAGTTTTPSSSSATATRATSTTARAQGPGDPSASLLPQTPVQLKEGPDWFRAGHELRIKPTGVTTMVEMLRLCDADVEDMRRRGIQPSSEEPLACFINQVWKRINLDNAQGQHDDDMTMRVVDMARMIRPQEFMSHIRTLSDMPNMCLIVGRSPNGEPEGEPYVGHGACEG